MCSPAVVNVQGAMWTHWAGVSPYFGCISNSNFILDPEIILNFYIH